MCDNVDDMTNIEETFSTNTQHIAVLFVDEANLSHLTPTCEHIQGTTKVATEMSERGGFVCTCIPIEMPKAQWADGPNTDAPSQSPTGAATKAAPLEWPQDLPQAVFQTADDVQTWLASLPRKLEPSDISQIPTLKRWAKAYAMDETNHTMNDGSENEFIVSVADACARYEISPGQAKGVLNWWRAQAVRNRPATVSGNYTETTSVDLTELPAGFYAVPGGDTRLKVKITKPGERSKWHGWIFVDDGGEYGNQTKYGRQKPDQYYTGQIVEQLKAIAADPQAAAARYGQITGTCGICGRKLEDEESVARGIGPICATKF